MKAAVFHGPRDIRTEEVEKPVIGENEVLVRVRACGICGSDLHMYKLDLHPEKLCRQTEKGGVPGHEYSGEVVEVGSSVQGFDVGDRVSALTLGGMAEYNPAMVFPGLTVHKLPDEVSFEEAATLEPLANSIHATMRGNPKAGERAVVFGAGIIGLGIVQYIGTLGIDLDKLIVVDVSDRRLEKATQLGADITINAAIEDPYKKMVELLGETPLMFYPSEMSPAVDIVYDCVGYIKERPEPPVIQQAINIVREGTGRIVCHGIFEEIVPLELSEMVLKQADVLGSFGFTAQEMVEALELMRTGKVDRKCLVSHEFPLDEAKEAFEMQCRTDESVKVLVKP